MELENLSEIPERVHIVDLKDESGEQADRHSPGYGAGFVYPIKTKRFDSTAGRNDRGNGIGFVRYVSYIHGNSRRRGGQHVVRF